MVNLAKKGTITIGPTARCTGHDIILSGHIKDQCYNSWKYILTIISDRDSDSIGVRVPRAQDAWEEKVQHQLTRWQCKILGKWLWKWVRRQGFIIIKPRRGWGVADGISGNLLRLTKDGFPQLCEQGDNICHIKWYNEVCSRKTYTAKHWLKGAPEIWA